MADTIRFKRSSTSGSRPAPAQLVTGEVAINSADGQMFTKTNSGAVVQIGKDDYGWFTEDYGTFAVPHAIFIDYGTYSSPSGTNNYGTF